MPSFAFGRRWLAFPIPHESCSFRSSRSVPAGSTIHVAAARSTFTVGLIRRRRGRGLAGEQPSLSVQTDEVKALGRLAFDVATQCRDGYAALETDVRDMLES